MGQGLYFRVLSIVVDHFTARTALLIVRIDTILSVPRRGLFYRRAPGTRSDELTEHTTTLTDSEG